jgi:hypothetical protein
LLVLVVQCSCNISGGGTSCNNNNFGNEGGEEGFMLGENADGERPRRRDSAMDTDTACDLGDVVVLEGGGGVDEGGGESAESSPLDIKAEDVMEDDFFTVL